MFEVKQFPRDMGIFEVDRSEVKRCLLTGLFEESVEINGSTRRFYTYLKPGLLYNRPCLVIAPPSEKPALDWLKESIWLSFAKAHDLFLHILVPEAEGWRLDGADADYMNQVYVRIQSRRAYVTMQDNIYAMGLGQGAIVAQQAVMKMSSEWSGLATFGELSEAAMLNADALHGSENTGKTELSINAAKAQVPVWMAWRANTGANAEVCAYWKKQNDAGEERFSGDLADEIYFPSTVCKSSQINEEKISQVRVTNGFAAEMTPGSNPERNPEPNAEPDREFADAVWAFLSKACRHRGFGHKMLRNRIDPDAYGFTLHTMEHQGFVRRWYEYVPEAIRRSGAAVPLVFCMHGRGGTADSFLSLSGMSRVAEERNFIAVFPEASVYQQKPDGIRNLLLWDGFYKEEETDDTAFILKILEDVKGRHALDMSRIYACGQSSGGMMATTLAHKAPGVFAAVSPWSALVNPDRGLMLPEKIDPSVPFLFLFGDSDWLTADREHGEMEFGVTAPVAAFLKNLIRLYGLREKPLRYVCGEISYFVYPNAKGVPMLTVGRVAGMTHANYPRESWIAYDEFLSKFSKTADGVLLYMGEPAE